MESAASLYSFPHGSTHGLMEPARLSIPIRSYANPKQTINEEVER